MGWLGRTRGGSLRLFGLRRRLRGRLGGRGCRGCRLDRGQGWFLRWLESGGGRKRDGWRLLQKLRRLSWGGLLRSLRHGLRRCRLLQSQRRGLGSHWFQRRLGGRLNRGWLLRRLGGRLGYWRDGFGLGRRGRLGQDQWHSRALRGGTRGRLLSGAWHQRDGWNRGRPTRCHFWLQRRRECHGDWLRRDCGGWRLLGGNLVRDGCLRNWRSRNHLRGRLWSRSRRG